MPCWKVIEKREGASPLLGFVGYFSPLTKDPEELWGVKLDFLVEFKNQAIRMVAPIEQLTELEKFILKKIEDEEFVRAMRTGFVKAADRLEELKKKFEILNYKEANEEQLAQWFDELMNKIMQFSKYSHWINFSDFENHFLTEKLKNILKKYTDKVSEAFVTLTTPTKKLMQQTAEEELLRIAKDASDVESLDEEKLERHAQKYCWLQYEQEGDPLTKEYFKQEIKRILEEGIDPGEALKEKKENRKEKLEEKKELQEELGLPEEDIYWFHLAADIMYLKVYMREVKVRAYCTGHWLMEEIAERLKLNKVEVRHLLPEELKQALKTGNTDKKLLRKRINHSVAYCHKGDIKLYTGQKAVEWSAKIEEDEAEDTGVLRGQCASPGRAEGTAKLVLHPRDMDKFEKGDILVAYMTDPGVVPAMKKAAAIVTDVGGITCHAAIVSRELGIPCVVGTKHATKLLEDGEEIVVDADKGEVRKVDG